MRDGFAAQAAPTAKDCVAIKKRSCSRTLSAAKRGEIA